MEGTFSIQKDPIRDYHNRQKETGKKYWRHCKKNLDLSCQGKGETQPRHSHGADQLRNRLARTVYDRDGDRWFYRYKTKCRVRYAAPLANCNLYRPFRIYFHAKLLDGRHCTKYSLYITRRFVLSVPPAANCLF